MCKKIYVDREKIAPLPRELLKAESKTQTLANCEVSEDVLAKFTAYTKTALLKVKEQWQAFMSTKCFRILSGTTQPAHLILMACIIFLAAVWYPAKNGEFNVYYQFIYNITIAAHFGSQIWMTFISGLSLYFTLPRHDFGEVQKILFPIYFSFTGLLSAFCIASHVQLQGVRGSTILLIICFLVEILVRVHLCSPLLSLIDSKNEVEAQHGLGREVGKLARDSELFSTPSYAVLHNKFRRLHMVIALANMSCISLSTLHIWLSLQCQMC